MNTFGSRSENTFGQLLEEFLSLKDLPKKDLAEMVDLSPSQISHLISGTKKATPELINKLSDRLGLDEQQRESLLRVGLIASTPRSSGALSLSSLGGIVEVHQTYPAWRFNEWIMEAKECIRIQETWIGGNPSVIFAKGFRRLVEIQEEKRVRIPIQVLLMDYKGITATQRGSDIRLIDEKAVPMNILGNLWDFDALRKKLDIEVKLYKNLPSFELYQCDQRALLGFYIHGDESHTSPHLEIRDKSTMLFQMIEQEFNELWNTADPMDWEHTDIVRGRTLVTS